MARIFLVFGSPGNGKSTLAKKLSAEHQFGVVAVDNVYVDSVKAHWPTLYFDAVGEYVAQHYHYILVGDYSQHVFKRNLVAEWHAHLLDVIRDHSSKHDRLVVEGYLLFDCKDEYVQKLTTQSTQSSV